MKYKIANGTRDKVVQEPVYLLLDEHSQTIAEFGDEELRNRVWKLLNEATQQAEGKAGKETSC